MMEEMQHHYESNVPWIGKMPSTWRLGEIAHFTRSMSGGTPSRNKPEYWDDGDIPWMSSGEVNKGEVWDTNERITQLGFANSSAKLLKKNTVVIALNGQGKTKGMSAILKIEATCNQSLCGFMCDEKNLTYKYLYYCFQAMYKYLRSQAGDDSREGLAAFFVKKQKIPVPSIDEQKAIADYLDAECKKIDDLIEREENRVQLIEQTKLSVITKVITKGLAEAASMKDSGVPWVGQVPSSWERHRIKYDLIRSAAGIWGDEEKGNDDDIFCYRIADYDYSRGIIDNDNPTIRNIPTKERQGRLLRQGDLLIEKSGGGDIWPVGRVVRYNYDNEAVCSNFIHSITVDERKIDKDFLYYYFRFLYANKVNLLYFNQTTGIQNLKVGAYLSQSLYAPQLSEQREIVEYLNKECDAYDAAIDKANHQILLLKEYKQSLITEVVTGKRKVC